MARRATFVDSELGAITDDRLTRDVRVYQREKGHRFSSDDVITAFVAVQAAPGARRVLDLGCGLGSVLLHLAWSLPEATLVGIEAQAVSFELLRRNLARSGFAERVRIMQGDLRDSRDIEALGSGFDLITGTPPYFAPAAALEAEDEQRAYARLEYRGGVEAYVSSAAALLTKAGVIVLCGDARAGERVLRSAAEARVCARARCDVTARDGRPALFSVWTLMVQPGDCLLSRLVLRDAQGGQTEDALRLRAFSGF